MIVDLLYSGIHCRCIGILYPTRSQQTESSTRLRGCGVGGHTAQNYGVGAGIKVRTWCKIHAYGHESSRTNYAAAHILTQVVLCSSFQVGLPEFRSIGAIGSWPGRSIASSNDAAASGPANCKGFALQQIVACPVGLLTHAQYIVVVGVKFKEHGLQTIFTARIVGAHDYIA